MRTFKKLLLSILLMSLTGMAAAGGPVTITQPYFDSDNSIIDDALNTAVGGKFRELQDDINSELSFLPDNLDNFARAFANAAVFSSDGASQRGYEGYKAFSITVGFMGAFQVPKKITTLVDEFMDAAKSEDEKEISEYLKRNMNNGLGLDLQVLNAQLGINTSKFLLDGLYLGFKFSVFDTNRIKAIDYLSGFSFKTMSIGVNASYQLIKQKRLPGGLLVWRGLNLGTGFIWQNTSLGLSPAIKPLEIPIYSLIPVDLLMLASMSALEDESMAMMVNPVFNLRIDTNTYIIPIEAMTSMRLFWFLNLALGAGVDVAFGGSNIETSGHLDVIKGPKLPNGITMTAPKAILNNLDGESPPGIFNAKLMGAVGFSFGPIIIDIPLTYYFKDNGYSLGVTLGFTL